MHLFHILVAGTMVIALSTGLASAGEKKKVPADGKSARTEQDAPRKKDGAHGDLASRVDALERQLNDLSRLIKQQHQQSAHGKPGVSAHADASSKGQPSKQPAIPGKPAMPPHHHVKLLKGPDGQLYVPLSALPPGLQGLYRGHDENDTAGQKQADHGKHAESMPDGKEPKKAKKKDD
jgi:hypothetical protein